MSNTGKKIRPMLLLMSCDMFGGDVHQALDSAFAIEVFHNFTLVHDDIMDAAELRRGNPAVHIKYGVNKGILAGDVMLSYAYQYLCSLPAEKLVPVLQVFNQTAIEIMEGQQMDIDFEKRIEVAADEYLKMIEYKTSVLLAAALKIGSIIAGADEKSRELVYSFGLKLGLSFQITDDLLDTFGDGSKVGKKIGGDILNNKKTLLLITALNNANPSQREQLFLLMNEQNEDKKIAETIRIFNELNTRELIENKAEELFAEALQSLDSIQIPDNQKSSLKDLAYKIRNRDY
jgi:geranylgeranyl diphosphate synthase type II